MSANITAFPIANVKPSELTAASSCISSDYVIANISGTTLKLPLSVLITMLDYQPGSANLDVLSNIIASTVGLNLLAFATPTNKGFLRINDSGVPTTLTNPETVAELGVQPAHATLTALSLLVPTTLGKQILITPNVALPRYLRASGDAQQTVQQFSASQVASDIRPYILQPPISKTTSAASDITPVLATGELTVYTALANNVTISPPTGSPGVSPFEGQILTIRIKDNGVARTLTWSTATNGYRATTPALPTTTIAGKTHYMQFIYNLDDTKWDLLSYTVI